MGGEAPSSASGGEQSTFAATTIGVCANLVGAGLLSLPYTLKRAGLVTGVCAMMLMCILNALSLLVIARCCDMSGAYTYLEVGRVALGRRAATAITVVMVLYTLGSCVAFTVLLGDFLPALMCKDGCANLSPVLATLSGRTALIGLVSAMVLFPLALLRNLNNLRFTSTLSAVCILYTALMVSLRAVRGPTVAMDDIPLTAGSTGLFISLPVTCVAFTLHYNVPRFYFELRARSLARMGAVAATSFGTVLVLYQVRK